MISAPMITLTGVLGLDALSLYRTEKRPSSIAGKISSAKILPKIFPELFSHAQLGLSSCRQRTMVDNHSS